MVQAAHERLTQLYKFKLTGTYLTQKWWPIEPIKTPRSAIQPYPADAA